MDDRQFDFHKWLIIAVFAVMAAAAVACLVSGLSLFGISVSTWLEKDFDFAGWDIFDWIIGLIGAGLIHTGLLIAGLFFRFLKWIHAPRGSLAVAIVSVPYILFSFVVLDSPLGADEGLPHLALLAAAFLSLLILSLPPFLHWRASPVIARLPT